MAQFDYIVIGSGVSSMTFAHRAAEKGRKLLVLEKMDTAGGCLFTAEHDGFWLELGGHTVYSSYATYIDSMKKIGMEKDFAPRVKAPFKMLTDKSLGSITSTMSFLELMLNGVKLFFLKKEGKTVREYYSAILGKGNYEKMFRPMIQAVISQEGSDFPADLMLKSRPKDKSMPRSFTIKGGMNKYIRNVAEMDNVTLKTSCGAASVSYNDGVYTVTDDNGEHYSAENLAVGCHPVMAGALLNGVSPELSQLLMSIPSAKVESMGIILDKDSTAIEPLSFIVAGNSAFTSVVSRDILPDGRYRGFSFHFKPDTLTYDEKIRTAESILGTDSSKFIKIQEREHLCPTLSKGHEELAEKIDNAACKVKGLVLLGNYFGGLAIEDCSARSAKEAQRVL